MRAPAGRTAATAFAYWSATPSQADPASLWVADRDGSNRHRVSGGPDLRTVADLASQVQLVAGR